MRNRLALHHPMSFVDDQSPIRNPLRFRRRWRRIAARILGRSSTLKSLAHGCARY
jgi:hypothetical protein